MSPDSMRIATFRARTLRAMRRRGSATFIVILALIGSLSLAMLLSRRSEGLRNLSRRSRYAEQAEALALSALEEGRIRFMSEVNVAGSGAWKFARTARPEDAAMALVPELTQAIVAAGPTVPETVLEPVAASFVDVRRSARSEGVEAPLDWAYGFGYMAQLRLQVRVRVDRAARVLSQFYDVRLTNVRPPVPCDRVRLYFTAAGGLEGTQFGDMLGRLAIDEGPEGPLKPKITSFFLGEEPKMLQSFNPLLASGSVALPPLAAASYVLPTAQSAFAFLYPVTGDDTAMVLPEGMVLCATDLELREQTRFRFHGVLACAGNVRVQGLIREVAEGSDDSMVLMTLGPEHHIRADERPIEAALIALGDRSVVEPATGASRLQLHGLLASAVPSGILTGVFVYDPVQFNGRADGPYAAPEALGNPAPALNRLPTGDLPEAAYRFSMAQFAASAVAETP